MEEVAYSAVATMNEAEVLRGAITYAVSLIGGLGAIVVGIIVWIYKGDQKRLNDNIARQSEEAKESRAEIARKIDEREISVGRMFDTQTRALDGMRQALFDDGQAFRDLFHQHDKRLDRLEREDMRRSMMQRRTDAGGGE